MTNFSATNWQRGDVVLCQVPMPSTQLQQVKLRPAIVISTDSLNQVLDDVMVVPCTSNTKRPLTPTQYLITADAIALAGIRVESIVRCEAILTLNQTMILRKLGVLSVTSIEQVNQCLRNALDL